MAPELDPASGREKPPDIERESAKHGETLRTVVIGRAMLAILAGAILCVVTF